MAVTKEQILTTLKEVQDPELARDIVALGMVKEVGVEDGRQVFVHLEVTSPQAAIGEQIKGRVQERLQKVPGVGQINIQISRAMRQGTPFQPKMPLPGIRHVLLVASGKGGVGKTTTAVNLALALVKKGYQIGLMDADIYGPNVPLMLGVPGDQRPRVSHEEKMIPIEAYGLKMISMGVLVPADQPMVWRGPMLHGAVTQFLQKVEWGELDFLIIDLPPGTGDVQLSLAQSVAVTGAVIVTTPQEVALMDVRKAVAMFRKTSIPILGVIENMTGEIFGSGGGQKAAEEFKVPFLGKIPLDPQIRKGGDAGQPVVVQNPKIHASIQFQAAADLIVVNLKTAVPAQS